MIDSLSSRDAGSGEEESASRDSASGEEKVISGEEGREKASSEKPIVASFFIHLSDSIPKEVFIVKPQ